MRSVQRLIHLFFAKRARAQQAHQYLARLPMSRFWIPAENLSDDNKNDSKGAHSSYPNPLELAEGQAPLLG